jgi:peptide-methionine (S)-S-oxide reductase
MELPGQYRGRLVRRSLEACMETNSPKLETITLGGGCFWCLEAVYDRLEGVKSVVSGYAGGHVPNPGYDQVCGGRTGHAEVVKVDFDPDIVTLADVLRIFFTIHDPTTPDQQGADVGPQYRSAIFFGSPEQKQVAEDVIRELDAARVWDQPIVTQIAPLDVFYPAEDYHQEYFDRNGYQPYCQVVIAPKVAKFRSRFADRLKR